MWNKLSVSLENRKYVYFAGLVLFCTLLLGTGKAFALNDGGTYNGYHWYPNHGPTGSTGYNLISDNAYMQLAVSRDGYTDITRTNLKVYSTSTYISLEIFGADLCSNQPSYTTDEFFTSNRSGMTSSFSLSRAYDEYSSGRIGVVLTSAAHVADSVTTRYRGSCTADSAKEVLYARSNVYDQTLGMYVFNFEARAGADSGFVNGFRVRALRSATSSSGIFISADPGNSPDQFGLEVGYPRSDEGNPSASSTYADYAVPFVPDCQAVPASVTKSIYIYDDDNTSSSVQGSRMFKVKVQSTDGVDTDVAFTSITGESNTSTSMNRDGNGYYTVYTTSSKRTIRLDFTMSPTNAYIFRVNDLYQNNTLQISLPTTTSPNKRNCPRPATLDGVKIDDATGVVPYGGNPGTPATVPYNNLRTQVSSSSGTANPFTYTNAVRVTNLSGTNATVSVAALPAGSGWVLKGHTICQSSLPTCTNAYLTNPANIVGPGVRSFTHKFMPGTRYSMRWIYSRVVATSCLQPPTFNPSFPEPWQPFNLTTGVAYSNASYNPVNPRIALTIRNSANAIVYPTNTQTPTKSGTNTTYQFTNINLSAQPVGRYTATWVYTDSSPTSLTCTHTFYMGNKPFFHVLGGDIWVGGGGDTSNLQSWNIDNNPPAAPFHNRWGARSDFAALVSGDIRNYSTGYKTFIGTNFPSSLAFSNEATYVNNANALYGGSFEAVPPRTNYYNLVESIATPTAGSTVNLGTLASGVYKYTGDIDVYGTVPAGREVTIITDGKVTMSSAGGATIGYGAYASFDQIPRLNVFTESGDIMVGAGVRELHGFFSAGPGGNFYTCAFEPASGPTDPIDYDELDGNLAFFTIYAICNNQLKVYGSAQGDELILTRTFDSLRRPFSNPAEVFIYSPEAWLSRPTGSSTSGAVDFKSYIGLPPVL